MYNTSYDPGSGFNRSNSILSAAMKYDTTTQMPSSYYGTQPRGSYLMRGIDAKEVGRKIGSWARGKRTERKMRKMKEQEETRDQELQASLDRSASMEEKAFKSAEQKRLKDKYPDYYKSFEEKIEEETRNLPGPNVSAANAEIAMQDFRTGQASIAAKMKVEKEEKAKRDTWREKYIAEAKERQLGYEAEDTGPPLPPGFRTQEQIDAKARRVEKAKLRKAGYDAEDASAGLDFTRPVDLSIPDQGLMGPPGPSKAYTGLSQADIDAIRGKGQLKKRFDPRTMFDEPLSVVQQPPPKPFSIPAPPADVQALAQRREDTAKMADLKKRITLMKQEKKPLKTVGGLPLPPGPGEPGRIAGPNAMKYLKQQLASRQAVPPQALRDISGRGAKRGAETTDKFYKAITSAEGAGFHRTWVKGSGSSAYGPAQLTRDLAKTYRNSDIKWSPEESTYLDKFIAQGQKFLDVGGKDMEGALKERGLTGQAAENFRDTWGYARKDEDNKYISGTGKGALGNTARDRKLYEKVVKKMMGKIRKRTGNDTKAFWREWRFGKRGGLDPNKLDSRYAQAFNQSLGG